MVIPVKVSVVRNLTKSSESNCNLSVDLSAGGNLLVGEAYRPQPATHDSFGGLSGNETLKKATLGCWSSSRFSR